MSKEQPTIDQPQAEDDLASQYDWEIEDNDRAADDDDGGRQDGEGGSAGGGDDEEPQAAAGDGNEPPADTPAEPPSAGREPEIDPYQIAEAISLGISVEEARSLGDRLPGVMQIVSRQRQTFQQTFQQEPQRPQQQPTSPEPPQPPPELPKLDVEKFREEYGDELVDYLAGLHKHYESNLSQFSQQRQQYEQQQQQQAAEAAYAEIESAINGLGEEYKSHFGGQPLRSLNPSSAEFQNARKLAIAMDALDGVVPQDELAKRAAQAVFGTPQSPSPGNGAGERNSIREQMRDAQGRFLQKPTNRNKETLNPKERVVETINQFYEDRGIPLNEEFGDDDEF